MKKFFLTILIILSYSSIGYENNSIYYFEKNISGFTVKVVQINLNGSNFKIIPIIAQGGIGCDESFASMVSRSNAIAAINGCYFDKYTKKPIGDIAKDGGLLNWGGFGATWGIKNDGTIEFDYIPKWTRKDYSDFQIGISCIPYLVRDGEVKIKTKQDLIKEGFSDSHVFMKMPRSALGVTKEGKILFISVAKGIFMNEFANIVKALGVENAIGLDGGASVALYYNGKVIISPGRKLTNILAVVEK